MVVGVTGGIGSGKTWVSSLFQDLGIPIYISDIEAKKLMHSDVKTKNSIIQLFGKEVYVDNQLNRALISEKVFVDKSLLNELNAIVHPAVALHFDQWYKAQNTPFVIKESAIIFELNAQNKYDKIILVTAPEKVKLQRIQERDAHVSVTAIKQRMNNQWGDEKKIPLSDYVIENTDKHKTLLRVKEIYKFLINN